MSEVMRRSVCKRRGSPIGCCLLSLSYEMSRLGLADHLIHTFLAKQKEFHGIARTGLATTSLAVITVR